MIDVEHCGRGCFVGGAAALCMRRYIVSANFGAHSNAGGGDVLHVTQVHAAIWLVGLHGILAPAGKLSLKWHCLKILVIFWKKKQASLLCRSAELLTNTVVVNECSHGWCCWRLKEIQESHSKVLESHWLGKNESPLWPATVVLTFGHSRQDKD